MCRWGVGGVEPTPTILHKWGVGGVEPTPTDFNRVYYIRCFKSELAVSFSGTAVELN